MTALASSQVSRIKALQERHQNLKSQIAEEQHSPSATDFYLRQLKKQKLHLKEQIEGIRGAASAN